MSTAATTTTTTTPNTQPSAAAPPPIEVFEPVVQKTLDSFFSARRKEEIRISCSASVTLPNTKSKKPSSLKSLAFGRRHLAICRRTKGKILYSAHYLDITNIHAGVQTLTLDLSPSPKLPASNLKISFTDERIVQRVVNAVHEFYATTFATARKTPWYIAKFSDCPASLVEEAARQTAESNQGFEVGNCGGFNRAYVCMCEWMGQQPVREISWDVKNLFPLSGSTHLDLRLFRKESLLNPAAASSSAGSSESSSSAQEESFAVPLMAALAHNEYFKSVTMSGVQIPRSAFPSIGAVLRTNSCLTSLRISGCGLTKEAVSPICDGLVFNDAPSLTYLDVSHNPIEDKGLASLAACLSQARTPLVTLDVAGCGAGKVGCAALFNAIAGNVCLMKTLSTLDVSENSCASEASTALAGLLGKSPQLTRLYARSCSINMEAMKAAGSKSLQELDVGGNHCAKLEVAKKLAAFLVGCPALLSLSISSCQLVPESFAALLPSTTAESRLATLSTLDASNNELGDEGVAAVLAWARASRPLRNLSVAGCFGRKTKSRPKLVSELVALAKTSDMNLVSLNVAATKHPLKGDISQFMFEMINNTSITSLNVSGHQLESAAVILSRVVQANTTLASLRWDCNNTTFDGLEFMKLALSRNATIVDMPSPSFDLSRLVYTVEKQPAELDRLLETAAYVCRGTTKDGVRPIPAGKKSGPLPPGMTATARVRVKRAKPAGVDTLSACQLFVQIKDYMAANPEDAEVSPRAAAPAPAASAPEEEPSAASALSSIDVPMAAPRRLSLLPK